MMIDLKKLDLDDLEAQFGLMIRERRDHNNYALFRFEDLDKIAEYYELFKKEIKK